MLDWLLGLSWYWYAGIVAVVAYLIWYLSKD